MIMHFAFRYHSAGSYPQSIPISVIDAFIISQSFRIFKVLFGDSYKNSKKSSKMLYLSKKTDTRDHLGELHGPPSPLRYWGKGFDPNAPANPNLRITEQTHRKIPTVFVSRRYSFMLGTGITRPHGSVHRRSPVYGDYPDPDTALLRATGAHIFPRPLGRRCACPPPAAP